MGLVKYDSVEQRQDVLEIMRKSKYNYRYYGKKVSLDALDHSISIEPVEDFFTYNGNNEFIERDMMEYSDNLLVNGLLETLSERESTVLEMYFGINRDEALSLDEITEEFDLTRERVRQIKEKGLARLRGRHDESTQQMKTQYIGHGEWYTGERLTRQY